MSHGGSTVPRTRRLLALPSVALLLTLAASCDPAKSKPASISPAQEASLPAAKDAQSEPRFAAGEAIPNDHWWPDQLDLRALRHNEAASPHGADFDYAAEFVRLDLDAVKADIAAVLTDSKDWWPADYGNYGPLMVRLSWHSAGTYRVTDGRGGSDGGQIRFEPLNSWPDNGNLDKARRLLWPVKKKYGRALSWADLMVLAGTVGMETMGFETLGFAGGREDDWEADLVYWGPEAQMLGSDRFHGDRTLDEPLAAAHMGLIYVNPEGPNGNGDPVSAAHDIRETFSRMAMNDEETVALIAGGHTFGKSHGAHEASECAGPEPAAATITAQGLGWANACGTGKGADTITSGLEGAWTAAPVKWTHQYLQLLFDFEWEQHEGPGGAKQWRPANGEGATLVPDAHDPSIRHAPMMLTTDLSLREDPAYATISQRFRTNPEEFEQAFARAWFKLTHRDLGPRARYLGPDVPEEVFAWQDPLPKLDHPVITAKDIESLAQAILSKELSPSALIRTAWASASTYRDSDMRGGANGARVRLAPQKDWAVNNPDELDTVLQALSSVQHSFNESAPSGRRVSMADLIVLAGAVGIEEAARRGGLDVTVSFTPGRVDATQAQTDVPSFAPLEPKSDGFRNYYTADELRSPAAALVDKADLLDLTVPEMTVLLGGLRVLGNNADGSRHGVLTKKPGTLSNDFFVNLLDLSTTWSPTNNENVFEGRDENGSVEWTATEVDLVFGSNAELRAVAEVYASDEEAFVRDFVAVWTKIMRADRFDLHR